MLIPQVYELAKAASAVTALIGNPPRLFEFGQANEPPPAPYVTWTDVSGTPENIVNTAAPSADHWGVQIDCYAVTSDEVRAIAIAMRDALQLHALVTSWNGGFLDNATQLFRYSFTVDFLTDR